MTHSFPTRRSSDLEEWHQEAEKRGLPNLRTTPTALDAYITPKAEKLFTEQEIYTEREQHASYEILLEAFIKKSQTEGRVLGDLVKNHLIQTALTYYTTRIKNVKYKKKSGQKQR